MSPAAVGVAPQSRRRLRRYKKDRYLLASRKNSEYVRQSGKVNATVTCTTVEVLTVNSWAFVWLPLRQQVSQLCGAVFGRLPDGRYYSNKVVRVLAAFPAASVTAE